jgi:hypothetical protein
MAAFSIPCRIEWAAGTTAKRRTLIKKGDRTRAPWRIGGRRRSIAVEAAFNHAKRA